jgi:hypothetical protein
MIPQIQIRTIRVALLGIVLGFSIAPCYGQAMTDRQACKVEMETFPLQSTHEVHFVKEGLLVDLPKQKQVTLAYTNMSKVDFSLGIWQWSPETISLHMRNEKNVYTFTFPSDADLAKLRTLQSALNTLMQDAQQGKPFICSNDPRDLDNALVDFQQKTSAWRALSTKPEISEEVYKDRLLAEDALKKRDLPGAVTYYEAGVTSDPTWEQGWYNVALVYAELQDYFDAARCMKHYVILVPDAPDVRAAKDNIILWEAKAAQRESSTR